MKELICMSILFASPLVATQFGTAQRIYSVARNQTTKECLVLSGPVSAGWTVLGGMTFSSEGEATARKATLCRSQRMKESSS